MHSATKYPPNQIFYSEDEKLFEKVLENIKESFKSRGAIEPNFKDNEKCLLNKKFKIKKYCNKSRAGILIYDKIKNKKLYGKVNVTFIKKMGLKYKIKIEAD